MATHATMVLKRVRRKGVPRINPKKSLSPFYGEIVIYPTGPTRRGERGNLGKDKGCFLGHPAHYGDDQVV